MRAALHESSIDEPHGTYAVTATVTWTVSAVIDGEPADPATLVTDGQIAVRVEELQALVTCVGGSELSCQPNEARRASPINEKNR